MASLLNRTFIPAARAGVRSMSGGLSESAAQAKVANWTKISYGMGAAVGLLVVYNISAHLSHHHEHEDDKPQPAYMRIRAKEFPWGPCSPMDYDCKRKQAAMQG